MNEARSPAEEQPLPPVDSPTAESPGYVTESALEEDLEEYEDNEIEDGSVDYPMDGGDDEDDDDGDSSRDDANDKDEEEDEEEEEEEHLAPPDSVVVPADEPISPPKGTKPVIPPPSTNITIRARITVQPQAFISLPPETEENALLGRDLHVPEPTGIKTVDYGFVRTVDAEARRQGISKRQDGWRRGGGLCHPSFWAQSDSLSQATHRSFSDLPTVIMYTTSGTCKTDFRGLTAVVVDRFDSVDHRRCESAFHISGLSSIRGSVLKKKITDKYCPRGEIKKLEIEPWNLKVKGNDVPAYTEYFQELTLICTKFVANKTEKVDKYINGLPDNIYGNIKSVRPKILDETIELANDLMD
ncbi:hypothetical protein Tco_0790209 [Tanacetum coccineum]